MLPVWSMAIELNDAFGIVAVVVLEYTVQPGWATVVNVSVIKDNNE